MTERLLQYIWQFQYYNLQQLKTTEGEPLLIIHPGTCNTNQGPDFLNAKIQTGSTTWAGNIELHIASSEWYTHQHNNDQHYTNVILHVVWKHDATASRFPFPTLELNNRISRLLLGRYEELMQNAYFIPCEAHIKSVPSIVLLNWKERLLIERLQQKTAVVQQLLQQNKGHWEETFWWMLARNFGTKINSDAFEHIARTIPVNLLAKNKYQLHHIEALLFGQAGLLEKKFTEAYPVMLSKEYAFLRKKYGLKAVHIPVFFLRMRPAGFPTVRLAQLAMLITESQHLFSKIREATEVAVVEKLLNVTANDYWHYHYTFDEPATFKVKALGRQMVQNILINTIVPILFAYGHLMNDEVSKEKALAWMEKISAEKNHITNGFKSMGIAYRNAADSQALIQLKNEYCNHKRCTQCAVGNKILKNL